MQVLNSKVIKTEKQEYIDENGNINTYVNLYIPATDENNKLLFSRNIFAISYSQREGLAIPLEL
jgi:hypothetical protein